MYMYGCTHTHIRMYVFCICVQIYMLVVCMYACVFVSQVFFPKRGKRDVSVFLR